MMARVDVVYLGISIAYLVIGVALGIGMGITQDFRYMHLHAHLNLVGFVAHAVFGFTHRLWPGLRQSALSAAQFWITVIGTPIFLFGLPLAQYHQQPIFAIIGSLMVLVGAVLFLVMFLTKSVREARAAA
jgi:hypothetical protein